MLPPYWSVAHMSASHARPSSLGPYVLHSAAPAVGTLHSLQPNRASFHWRRVAL